MTTVKENFNENIKNVIDLINNLKKNYAIILFLERLRTMLENDSELPYPVIENNKEEENLLSGGGKNFFIHLLFILSIIYSLTVSIKVPRKTMIKLKVMQSMSREIYEISEDPPNISKILTSTTFRKGIIGSKIKERLVKNTIDIITVISKLKAKNITKDNLEIDDCILLLKGGFLLAQCIKPELLIPKYAINYITNYDLFKWSLENVDFFLNNIDTDDIKSELNKITTGETLLMGGKKYTIKKEGEKKKN